MSEPTNKLFPCRLNFMVNEEMFNELNLIRRELDYKNMSVTLRKVVNAGLFHMANCTDELKEEYGDCYKSYNQLGNAFPHIYDARKKQFNKEHKEE